MIHSAWVAGSIVVILIATLTPQPDWTITTPDFFAPFFPTRPGAWRDVLQNILLYAPCGFLLRLRGVALFLVFLWATVLSGAIEFVQVIVPGRDAFAIDVVTNIAGAVIGSLVASTPLGRYGNRLLLVTQRSLGSALQPEAHVATKLSFGWAVLVALVFSATCWLLSPALPPPFFYAVASPSIDVVPGPVRIGGDGAGANFKGLIDEVRVYGRALTGDEIREDMSRGSQDTNAAEGRFDDAQRFDGTSTSTMASSETADFGRGMTLEAWVFPTEPLRGDVPLIAGPGDSFYLRASSDRALVPSAGGRFGAVSRLIRARRAIPIKEWTHLATTYDRENIRLYINGRVSGRYLHWSGHRPVRVTLNGAILPFGPVPDPPAFQSLLFRDFALSITLSCGRSRAMAAPVFLVGGIQSIDALAIESAGSELRVRIPSRAMRLGLASSHYRVPGVLSTCSPGESFSFTLRGPLQNPRLEDAKGEAMIGSGFGIGSGWTVLVDSQLMPVWVVTAASSCLLAALAFPFGLWARRRWPTVLGGIVLGAGVWLAPWLSRIQPPDPLQIGALLAGAVLGIVASRY